MKREIISNQDLNQVVGGTIMFSPDLSTCGKNVDNQYQVLDFDKAIDYINTHKLEMTERTMLQNMADLGYLAAL